MARAWTAVFRRGLMPAFETLSTTPVVVVMHHFGWAGPLPVWLLMVVMAVAAVAQRADVMLWIGGGDPQRRLGLRIALQVGLTTTLATYAIGWGPILSIGFCVSSLHHIRLAGSRAWVPALGWSLAGIATGQAAIALGLVPSYLPPAQAQVS